MKEIEKASSRHELRKERVFLSSACRLSAASGRIADVRRVRRPRTTELKKSYTRSTRLVNLLLLVARKRTPKMGEQKINTLEDRLGGRSNYVSP